MENAEAALNVLDAPQGSPAPSKGKAVGAKLCYIARDPASAGDGTTSAKKVQDWMRKIPLVTPYALEYLARQTASLERGRSAVLQTRLGGGRSLQELLSQLKDVLAPTLNDPKLALLAQFEEENARKTSPMSVQYPFAKREAQLDQYFTDPGGDVTDDELAVACDIVVKYIGAPTGRLRGLSLEAAMERLPKDTQWGLPYCVRGVVRAKDLDAQCAAENNTDIKNVIAYIDYRAAYLALAHEMVKDFNHPGWQDPCLMGWRGDVGAPTKDDPIGTKQRVVWMYPHGVSIIESAIYSVLTDYLRSKPGFAAWMTEEDTQQRVIRLLRQAVDERLITWAFDAKAFDQHLNEKLIDAVSRRIVQPYFQAGERSIIEQLSKFSKTCGMVTPHGVKTGRSYNRPSGSGGTNLLDCLENLVMAVVCMLRSGATEEEVLRWLKEVMGDDGLYNLSEPMLATTADNYRQAFGAVVNTGKEVAATGETSYLRRIYILDAGVIGAASANRVVEKGYWYEKPTPELWSSFLDEVRWFAQLETLRFHPQWEDVVRLYAYDWAPLHLGLDLEGGPKELFAIAHAYAEGRTLDELLGREDWALQFRGYSADDPETM